MPAEALPWTGERLIPTCNRPLIYEHLHRYALACGLAKGKRVLDIACGEGYGANLLAAIASDVIGVDLDGATIAHAKAKYSQSNLHFVQGSCSAIPCPDHSIDLVASFETIEHISEHEDFLSEIKRVLAPGGVLVISSPNKDEYQRVSEAANPFHAAELDHTEFVRLITTTFKHCVAAKQRLVVGSWIAPDAPSAKVSVATFHGWFDGIAIENGVHRGLYSIAVCSDSALPAFNLGMFENFRESADTWNLLDSHDTPDQISLRLKNLTERNEENEKQVLHLQRDAEEKSKHVTQLQGDLEEKSGQVAHFQREAEEKSGQVAQFQAESEEKAKHVAQLQQDLQQKTTQVLHFQRESDQQTQRLERVRNQFDLAGERLTRAQNELLDARWEALTLRGTVLRENNQAESSVRLVELENRAETAASERDHLRAMLTALQNDFEQARVAAQAREDELRDQLKAAVKELRAAQKQMDRLRENISRKLILPFGKTQRKLQQLTAPTPEND